MAAAGGEAGHGTDDERAIDRLNRRQVVLVCLSIAFVIGPVYNASHGPQSIFSSIVAEVIGVAFVYLTLFGGMKRIPFSFSRVISMLVFALLGIGLIGASFLQLRSVGAGNAIAITVFFITAATLAGFQFFYRWKFRGSAMWPAVQGTIETSEFREVRTRSSHYFVAEQSYSYQVNGEYYSGRFDRQFDSESEACDYVEKSRGQTVAVKFNPAKPESSCVDNDDATAL